MNRNIKVLGIAPYEGMKSLMMRLAKQRENIDLTVYVGDMEAGADIASRHSLEDYDIILSRGGTAELISATSPIPVVEIQLSVYDILRAIKLAENQTDRYAIAGFSGITKNAQFLCELLQYDIDIYTIHSSEEVQETLTQLSERGYMMILCDVITNSYAQRLGMRSILFTSGSESVEAAFDQAVKTADLYQGIISKSEFFKTLLEDYPYYVFVYDEKGELTYTSRAHTFSPSLLASMKNYVPDVLLEKDKKFYRDEANLLIAIRGMAKIIHKQTYAVYYVNTRKVPLSLIKNGIRYISRDQAFEFYHSSIYGFTNPAVTMKETLEQINQGNLPVMIQGEIGCCHEAAAHLIYAQSKYQNKPMAIIDCSRIVKRGWEFLTEHTNSPFSDTFTTIYIREIDLLPEPEFCELMSIIRDLNLHKKNRILFSYITRSGEQVPERCQLLMNQFSCLPFVILPFKDMLEELPSITNLCISDLNMQLAKELIGLEPEAAQLLKNYNWPGNYDQFKRILTELVSITDTPFIKAVSVNKLLLREQPQLQRPGETGMNLNRTLEEINLDILRQVLSEESGNQTAAAKRLGISRTTLWRMLQNHSL